MREAELRQLRKQNTEYEEQNAVLSKHVENMKQAIEKLEAEAAQQRKNNDAFLKHLDVLRTTLVANFSRLPLPGLNLKHGYDRHNLDIVFVVQMQPPSTWFIFCSVKCTTSCASGKNCVRIFLNIACQKSKTFFTIENVLHVGLHFFTHSGIRQT